MLDRCAAAAVGELDAASDQREANIFRLAALVLGPRFDAENRRLMLASERYFKEHPADVVPSVEVVRRLDHRIATPARHAYRAAPPAGSGHSDAAAADDGVITRLRNASDALACRANRLSNCSHSDPATKFTGTTAPRAASQSDSSRLPRA